MYINPKKKPRLMKRMLKEQRIIHQNPDLYRHYLKIGYQSPKATTLVKETAPSRSLEKLTKQYETKMNLPGVQGISLEGIKRTRKVERWISQKEKAGMIEDKGYMLKFPKNEELGRY